MNSNNLITNALLATTWECSRKDYIDLISPFIVYASYHESDINSRYIDINKVKTFIKAEFSMTIVESVIICVFNRNKNLFFSKKIDGSKRYYTNSASTYDFTEFERKRLENSRNYDYFIEKMAVYFKNEMSKDWDKKRLEDKLFKFINHNFSRILTFDNQTSNYRDLELANFLNYISENDRSLLLILQNIVKGQMIYTAIYAQNIADADCKQKMRNLNVYFDTTFIFNLLGYGGKYNEEYTNQIVSLLKGLGAKLFCFNHNYLEVKSILEVCESKICHGEENQLYNLDFFLDNNYTSADMLAIISGLKERISRYMNIVETPDFSMPTTNIDWGSFSKYLQEKIGYRKDSSLEHDVQSIAAIFRLREGKLSNTIEGCGAIFITTNLTLVKAVKEYHKSYDDMKGFWACISDYEISNIAWLKSPDRQNEIVNKNIQYATALLQEPSQDFWRKFVAVVDKFKNDGKISDTDALELKYEAYSRRNAGDFFDDDEKKINLVSLQELLLKIRAQHQQETLDKLEKSTSKIEHLKTQDMDNADKKAKKKGKFALIWRLAIYLASSAFALSIAGASIYHLVAERNEILPIIVLVLEILGVVASVIVPALRKIWNIKAVLLNSYQMAYERENKRLHDEIEQKYTIDEGE